MQFQLFILYRPTASSLVNDNEYVFLLDKIVWLSKILLVKIFTKVRIFGKENTHKKVLFYLKLQNEKKMFFIKK